MDEKDIKLDRLLDMQDNPQNYTDEELEAMLNDPEMQKDIRCLIAMRRASLSEKRVVSSEKWTTQQSASANHYTLHTTHYTLLKLAAMFIGCILLAGIAYAAVRFIKQREPMPIAENTEEVVKKAATESAEMKTDTVTTAKATLIVFDGEEMESVAQSMAEYYGVNVRFDSEEAKHVKLFFRWDKNMPIATVVEILNKYDRINIELADGTIILR